jgi:hypothetical protein
MEEGRPASGLSEGECKNMKRSLTIARRLLAMLAARSVTREIERIRAPIEIPNRVRAVTVVDLICAFISSASSLEIETISSLDASLRKVSYLLPNFEGFALLDT